MNQIKKQVCSLDAAKFFREKGLEDQSLFYYVLNWKDPRGNPVDDGEHIVPAWEKHITKLKGRERGSEIEFLPAYTLVELNAFWHGTWEHNTIEKQVDFILNRIKDKPKCWDYTIKITIDYMNDRYRKFFELVKNPDEV